MMASMQDPSLQQLPHQQMYQQTPIPPNRRALPTPPSALPSSSPSAPSPVVSTSVPTHNKGVPSNSSFMTALDTNSHFDAQVHAQAEPIPAPGNVIGGEGDDKVELLDSAPLKTSTAVSPLGLQELGGQSLSTRNSGDLGAGTPGNGLTRVNGYLRDEPSTTTYQYQSLSQSQLQAPATPPRKSTDSSAPAPSPRSQKPPPTSFPSNFVALQNSEIVPVPTTTPTTNGISSGVSPITSQAVESAGNRKKSTQDSTDPSGKGEELMRKASRYYSTTVAAAQIRALSPEPVPQSASVVGPTAVPMSNSASAPNMRTTTPTSSRRPVKDEIEKRRAPPVQQEEVCIECMMRDQDMIDVDVTSPGVWSRASDADFEEAMRMEEEEELRSLGIGDSSSAYHGSNLTHSREGVPSGSGSPYGSKEGSGKKKRKLGRGQKLTTPALRLWTNMNPPASNFRWKTLQAFLATQAHYLELERHAREASAVDREHKSSMENFGRYSINEDRGNVKSATNNKHRVSTLLPNGMMMEKVDTRRDEKDARHMAKKRPSESRSRGNSIIDTSRLTAPISPMSLTSPPSPYDANELPWMAGPKSRRFSSPVKVSKHHNLERSPMPFHPPNLAARSSTDLRSYSASLAPSLSPSRMSMGAESRLSIWSRGRRSATQSVLSLAPSGSMMDMHLGLFNDKHLPLPRDQDPRTLNGGMNTQDYRANSPEQYTTSSNGGKKKKKGLRAILSLLNLKGGDKKDHLPQSQVYPPQVKYQYEDDVLRPPPSMNMLARDHQRSKSSSSLNSLPPGAGPSYNTPMTYSPMAHSPVAQSPAMSAGQLPADRRSVMSYNSVASKLMAQGQSPSRPQPLRRPSDSMSMSSRRGTQNTYDAYLTPSPNPNTYAPTVVTLPPDAGQNLNPNMNYRNSIMQESNEPTIRREKSLPALPPSESPQLGNRQEFQVEEVMNGYFPGARSESDDWGNQSGRNSRQTKTKSRLLGFGRKKSKSRDLDHESYAPAPEILHAVSREAPLLAFRY